MRFLNNWGNTKSTATILFEIITFLIRKPLNHVTVIAKNAWEFPRGIISFHSILQENKETVTVMIINSEDPWKL